MKKALQEYVDALDNGVDTYEALAHLCAKLAMLDESEQEGEPWREVMTDLAAWIVPALEHGDLP